MYILFLFVYRAAAASSDSDSHGKITFSDSQTNMTSCADPYGSDSAMVADEYDDLDDFIDHNSSSQGGVVSASLEQSRQRKTDTSTPE